MPRLLPDRSYICYFCGTEYTLHSYVEKVTPYKHVGRTAPQNCPCCTAPTLLGIWSSPQSSAGDLVNIYGGLPPQPGDTPQSYLERKCVKVEDVNACLEYIANINFDTWEADLRKEDLSDPDTKREVEAELRVLPQMRQAVADGKLLLWLTPQAEAAKTTIERRRAEWQRMYEQNCGGKDEK